MFAARRKFNPKNIPGLVLWYAADIGAYHDAGSTLATNGQSVAQWNDLSSADNASQGAGDAYCPTFLTNQQNSLPALNAQDQGSVLTLASPQLLPSTWTIYAAVNRANSTHFDPAGGTSHTPYLPLIYGDNNLYFYDDDGHTSSTAYTGSAGWIYYRLRRKVNGNGSFTSTGMAETALNNAAFTTFTVGNLFYTNVGTSTGNQIGELVICGGDLAVSNPTADASMQNYLTAKWGLTYP